MPIKTHKVRIYPNAQMRQVLDAGFGYARYCYNQGLELWNVMYESFVLTGNLKFKPNGNKIRDILVNEKEDWQFSFSARILQTAILNLKKAWQNFFNPNMIHSKRPTFKSKRHKRQSFTTDRAKVVNSKYLKLDKPLGQNYDLIKMAEPLRFTGDIKTATITKRGERYFASIAVQVADQPVPQFVESFDIQAVDMNIGHFNANAMSLTTITTRILHLHSKIKHYNRQLARKRKVNPRNYWSHQYAKTKCRLNKAYLDIVNLQQDMLQKFTHSLLADCQTICVEDLNVNAMKMNKKLAKNLHRGLFGRARRIIEYHANWNHQLFIKADRFYPSTQRCSLCGFIKTREATGGKQTLSGDSINQKHQLYHCFNCGANLDRDKNAVDNLIAYAAGLTAE
jgi:putative transposase